MAKLATPDRNGDSEFSGRMVAAMENPILAEAVLAGGESSNGRACADPDRSMAADPLLLAFAPSNAEVVRVIAAVPEA